MRQIFVVLTTVLTIGSAAVVTENESMGLTGSSLSAAPKDDGTRTPVPEDKYNGLTGNPSTLTIPVDEPKDTTKTYSSTVKRSEDRSSDLTKDSLTTVKDLKDGTNDLTETSVVMEDESKGLAETSTVNVPDDESKGVTETSPSFNPEKINNIFLFCSIFGIWYAEVWDINNFVLIRGCPFDVLEKLPNSTEIHINLLNLLAATCVESNLTHRQCVSVTALLMDHCWRIPQIIVFIVEIRRTNADGALQVLADRKHFMPFQDWLKYRDVSQLQASLCALEFGLTYTSYERDGFPRMLDEYVRLYKKKRERNDSFKPKCNCSEVISIPRIVNSLLPENPLPPDLNLKDYQMICFDNNNKLGNWGVEKLRKLRLACLDFTINEFDSVTSKVDFLVEFSRYGNRGWTSDTVIRDETFPVELVARLASFVYSLSDVPDVEVEAFSKGFDVRDVDNFIDVWMVGYKQQCQLRVLREVIFNPRYMDRTSKKFWHRRNKTGLEIFGNMVLLAKYSGYTDCDAMVKIFVKIQETYYNSSFLNLQVALKTALKDYPEYNRKIAAELGLPENLGVVPDGKSDTDAKDATEIKLNVIDEPKITLHNVGDNPNITLNIAKHDSEIQIDDATGDSKIILDKVSDVSKLTLDTATDGPGTKLDTVKDDSKIQLDNMKDESIITLEILYQCLRAMDRIEKRERQLAEIDVHPNLTGKHSKTEHAARRNTFMVEFLKKENRHLCKRHPSYYDGAISEMAYYNTNKCP